MSKSIPKGGAKYLSQDKSFLVIDDAGGSTSARRSSHSVKDSSTVFGPSSCGATVLLLVSSTQKYASEIHEGGSYHVQGF
jgi:hypothetical protein